MRKWMLGILIVLMLVPCVAVQADELADLKARIEKLENNQKQSDWASRLKWSGDFRYRIEHASKENDDTIDRHRVRARLKLEAQVNDSMKFTGRLATGSSNSATSTNQTLGASDGLFKKFDVWIDQAFLTYTPGMIEGLDIYAGKMANPFKRVGKNQLIWDSDVNPDGAAAVYSMDLSDQLSLGGNIGGFWVNEDHDGPTDTILAAAQVYGTLGMEVGSLTAGASYYHFGCMKGKDFTSEGNTGSGTALTNDYELLEVFTEFKGECMELPCSVFATWVTNQGADDYDSAYMLGCSLNKVKDPGSWQVGYDYRDMEKDAVVGMFTDADPFEGGTTEDGGTGGTSHRFYGKYQLAKNVTAAGTYWISDIKHPSGDLDYNKVQFDIILKFK